MKKTIIRIFRILILLYIPSLCFGQIDNKVMVKAGFGIYQGVNIGVNYLYKDNLNAGLNLGSHFGLPLFLDDKHLSIALEHNFHFGRINKQNIKP